MSSIILLSGPVGAGKTTVAKELVTLSKAPVAYIEGDKFWSFIAKASKNQGPHKSFNTIMAAMTAAALPYASAGYEVIVDFSIPPWFLPTVHKIVRGRVPVDFVVLLPSEEVCAARAAARPEGKIPDYGPYRELFTDFAEATGHTISNDEADPTELASHIHEGIEAGIFRVNE